MGFKCSVLIYGWVLNSIDKVDLFFFKEYVLVGERVYK